MEDQGKLQNEGTSMGAPRVTLKQVVDYCQEHELLLRLLGVEESEIIRNISAERSRMREDKKRQSLDVQARRAIDELVRIGILRQEVNQDSRALFPGELWSDRLAILEAHEEI
jgi:hypothetical protein